MVGLGGIPWHGAHQAQEDLQPSTGMRMRKLSVPFVEPMGDPH